jgi:hypothetical protein
MADPIFRAAFLWMVALRALALTCLAALSVGCSNSGGTVTGEATYEGQPIERGYVTFTMVDGKGPVVGAAITNGRYTAEGVPAGTHVVRVEANTGAGPTVASSADAKQVSREWRGKVGSDGVIRTESIPANAQGNNQRTEVKSGSQTLDLHLTKPAGQK